MLDKTGLGAPAEWKKQGGNEIRGGNSKEELKGRNSNGVSNRQNGH